MRAALNRRQLLFLLGAGATVAAGRHGWSRLARPGGPDGPLGPAAQRLVARAWEGLDPARVLDAHVHILGLGAGGTGCYVNPRLMRYLAHPLDYLKFSLYQNAAGVEDSAAADAQYLARLVQLLRAQVPHGRALIFAFDQVHGEDGKADPQLSEFHTPNTYVERLAAEHRDLFVPCASVHPYRADAVAELERTVRAGSVAVKWLPNAMRIDPSSPRCAPFYQALVRLGIPLITHAGEEKAVEAEEAQRFGNPLLLRVPLDSGVKVVVAHCASLGQNPDLDLDGDPEGQAPMVDNFDLFLRVMSEQKYQGQLFGDLSALPQVNRVGRPLEEVLARSELSERVINGSDYPLPAINVLMQTGALEAKGYLSSSERTALNEIDRHDPLLFDFVLKRTLHFSRGGREHRFPNQAFLIHRGLFPTL